MTFFQCAMAVICLTMWLKSSTYYNTEKYKDWIRDEEMQISWLMSLIRANIQQSAFVESFSFHPCFNMTYNRLFPRSDTAVSLARLVDAIRVVMCTYSVLCAPLVAPDKVR